MKKPVVVKIGGSTFGSGDTVIEDLVALQKEGHNLVVVHGGANEVTGWLKRLDIPTKIADGLRVTDHESLRVVVAVLCGAVNKEIVADIQSLGGRAVGMCGIDGRLFESGIRNPAHGLVGEIVNVNTEPIEVLLKAGYMPVVAPSSYGLEGDETILNINGDPAAGALAAALSAEKLIMLTDVAGVMDDKKNVIHYLTHSEVHALIDSGVAAGGMIPKLEACLIALEAVPVAQIIDGREPHVLLDAVAGKEIGTIVA
jgi:acetylglutamate kinase